ncbi:MAG: alpha-L-rhamnosidase N-terminal domain-containing protein, partial [Clostridia bacterium]|nr:alpha-L-rhamnosidase N-terminal domain-containing protein [Clostridia bacterium]
MNEIIKTTTERMPPMAHEFVGKWISDAEMASVKPRNVFFRQLERVELDCREHRNLHILFRKRFSLQEDFSKAKIYISADDYYKLYVNGKFAGQGPAPSYHFRYNYTVIDISAFLQKGENVIAVHTLYQG